MKTSLKFILTAVVLLTIAAVTKYKLKDIEGIVPTLTPTELNYVDGVTSNVQTQLNDKVSTANSDTIDLAAIYNVFSVLRLMGSDVKGVPVGAPLPTSASNYAFTSGTAYMELHYIDRVGIAEGVRWGSTATASFTPDGTKFNGVTFFSVAPNGTYTRIASSANSATNFNAGNGGLQTVTFTTPVAVTPGLYGVVVQYNHNGTQTTAPQTFSSNAWGLVTQYAYNFSSGLIVAGTWAGQTAVLDSFAGTSFTRTTSIAQITIF